MKKNLGSIDRIIRLVIALVAVVLAATGTVTGTLAIVAGVVAVAMVATSAISWCPIYFPFGWSTKKDAK
jgi:hypothetical protein